jgi:hypothetical protein
MNRKVRDALVYARDLLAELVAEHSKGVVNLGNENNVRDLEQCQRLCAETLRELDGGNSEDD